MRRSTDRLRILVTFGILFTVGACSSSSPSSTDAGQDVARKVDAKTSTDSGGKKDTGSRVDASKADVSVAEAGTTEEASTVPDSTIADAGTSKDSGTGVDSGVRDAGEHDAGHDSGTMLHDAGHDSGSVKADTGVDSSAVMSCTQPSGCKSPTECQIVLCETVGSNPGKVCVYKSVAAGVTCAGGTCDGNGNCS